MGHHERWLSSCRQWKRVKQEEREIVFMRWMHREPHQGPRLRCGAVFPDLGRRRAVKWCIVGTDLGSSGSNVSVRMNLAVMGSAYLSVHSWKGRAENPDRLPDNLANCSPQADVSKGDYEQKNDGKIFASKPIFLELISPF